MSIISPTRLRGTPSAATFSSTGGSVPRPAVELDVGPTSPYYPSQLLGAIASSSETLVRQQHALVNTSKDIATITAQRSKQVAARTDRAAQLEAENQALREAEAELTKETRLMDEQLANDRSTLTSRQLDVESVQQKSVAISRQLSDTQRRADTAAANLAAAMEQTKLERARLERRTADLERSLAQLNEGHRRQMSAAVPREAAHRDAMAAKRREIAQSREIGEEKQKTLTSLRQLLDDNAREMEDASRRRRKAQEDIVRDYTAQRRAAMLQSSSDRLESERRIRSETDSYVEELRARIDTANAQLTQLRDDEAQNFAQEMTIRASCSDLAAQIVGIDAMETRTKVNEEQKAQLQAAVGELQAEQQRLRSSLQERHRNIAILSDSVAPLKDVEDACVRTAAEVRSKQAELADRDAEQAVWRVRDQERSIFEQDALVKVQAEIESTRVLRISESDRSREDLLTAQNELKVLTEEERSVMAKLQEMSARNAALDQTLEHIARQRRALAEEMALRRDAARMAAANLLAQLE